VGPTRQWLLQPPAISLLPRSLSRPSRDQRLRLGARLVLPSSPFLPVPPRPLLTPAPPLLLLPFVGGGGSRAWRTRLGEPALARSGVAHGWRSSRPTELARDWGCPWLAEPAAGGGRPWLAEPTPGGARGRPSAGGIRRQGLELAL
jgi:hypothetical protein